MQLRSDEGICYRFKCFHYCRSMLIMKPSWNQLLITSLLLALTLLTQFVTAMADLLSCTKSISFFIGNLFYGGSTHFCSYSCLLSLHLILSIKQLQMWVRSHIVSAFWNIECWISCAFEICLARNTLQNVPNRHLSSETVKQTKQWSMQVNTM